MKRKITLIDIILLVLMAIVISNVSYAQSDVPDKYWIDDTNFEEKINEKKAFGDDSNLPVVVEFWAKFNEANCLAEWEQLQDATYYRVDIAKASNAKKKYKVRMAPTIIIFKDGEEVKRYQADISFTMVATREEVQDFIDELIMSDF